MSASQSDERIKNGEVVWFGIAPDAAGCEQVVYKAPDYGKNMDNQGMEWSFGRRAPLADIIRVNAREHGFWRGRNIRFDIPGRGYVLAGPGGWRLLDA